MPVADAPRRTVSSPCNLIGNPGARRSRSGARPFAADGMGDGLEGASEVATSVSPRLLPSRHKDRDEEPLFRRRALALAKRSARSIVRARPDERHVVLIFGCQRSGTTMLQQTFLDRSWRVLILEEHDRRLVGPAPGPEETTWQEYSTVTGTNPPSPVRGRGSQTAGGERLGHCAHGRRRRGEGGLDDSPLPGGRAVQCESIRYGQPLPGSAADSFPGRDGLAIQGVTEETWETVTALLNRRLTPFDAAALFWWTRNQLYFDQRLWEDDRIRILRYERACNQPDEVIRSLSDHIGLALPLGSIAPRVRARPLPPETRELDPDVDATLQEAVGFIRRLPGTCQREPTGALTSRVSLR